VERIQQQDLSSRANSRITDPQACKADRGVAEILYTIGLHQDSLKAWQLTAIAVEPRRTTAHQTDRPAAILACICAKMPIVPLINRTDESPSMRLVGSRLRKWTNKSMLKTNGCVARVLAGPRSRALGARLIYWKVGCYIGKTGLEVPLASTAEIIDLSIVRKRRKLPPTSDASAQFVFQLAWVPFWFFAPVWMCQPYRAPV
jgi:hypothetical protein